MPEGIVLTASDAAKLRRLANQIQRSAWEETGRNPFSSTDPALQLADAVVRILDRLRHAS